MICAERQLLGEGVWGHPRDEAGQQIHMFKSTTAWGRLIAMQLRMHALCIGPLRERVLEPRPPTCPCPLTTETVGKVASPLKDTQP